MVLVLSALCVAAPKQHSDRPLLIPVTPPSSGGLSSYGGVVALPRRASPTAPWTSDFALVGCSVQSGKLEFRLTIGNPKNWPYTLPTSVTCAQGDVEAVMRLGFTDPRAEPWVASDGTYVIPRNPGVWTYNTFELPDPGVVGAKAATDDAGVKCEVQTGGENPRIGVGVDGPSTATEATCQLTTADGRVIEQQIAIVAY